MKTSLDPRHQRRIHRMQLLFSYSFKDDAVPPPIQDIIPHMGQIDALITEAAPEWPIDKIAKIDLAVLRNAVGELLFDTQVPQKVVIDEAVELAKSYGNDNSAKFVNGVLGTILKTLPNKP